jgi:C4-dicarboxylate transporter DctM subunit
MSEPEAMSGTLSPSVERPSAEAPALAARLFDGTVETCCTLLMVGCVAVALIQVFFRYVLNASLSWPEELARYGFVWFTFLGMSLTVRRQSYIAIELLLRWLPESARPAHELFVRIMIAATSVALLVHGVDFVGRSTYVSPALQWPFAYMYLAVPTGSLLNLVCLARQRRGLACCLAGGLLYGVVRGLGPMLLGDVATSTVLVAFAAALIFLAVPIGFALAFSAFAAFAPQGELLLLTLPQNMTASLDSFTLLAIPFFILGASLMNAAGITEKLLDVATRLVGHHRGGLGHVNVLTNTLMGGISGSSMADAAAVARALVPEMETRGYPRAFSAALTAAAGVLANLIPPSLGLIVYGALASASVGALFIATIVPGLLLATALSTVVHLASLRRGFGRDIPRATRQERLRSLGSAGPALVLPLVIVGGIRFGAFTATEAGAVATLYAVTVGGAVYRKLSARALLAVVRESLLDICAVMIIITAAAPFAWVLASERVPQAIAATLGSWGTNPTVLLLLINVFMLFVGLIMEMIAAMVILVPIFLPMISAAGIDPVHFGIVLVMNIVIGALTPPMGMLVFVTARVTGSKVVDVFREAMPFVAAMLLVLLLVTYLPWLSLALPRLIGP